MKCSDLQIGDLVRYRSKQIKVTSLYAKPTKGGDFVSNEVGWSYDESTWVDGDNIEPIPLTDKILEKSGFYFGYTSNEEDLASNTIAQLSEEDKGWVWDEGDGSIKVILPNESDGGMIIIDDQSFDRHLSLVYNNEVYVHELQHALRLCRLNELADNFKLEE